VLKGLPLAGKARADEVLMFPLQPKAAPGSRHSKNVHC